MWLRYLTNGPEFDFPPSPGYLRSVIDSSDPIYYQLRLWQFSNDNGKVVSGKLSTLPQRTTTKTDQYGNQFRYVARVVSTNPHASKYAYDVFFTAALSKRWTLWRFRSRAEASSLVGARMTRTTCRIIPSW